MQSLLLWLLSILALYLELPQQPRNMALQVSVLPLVASRLPAMLRLRICSCALQLRPRMRPAVSILMLGLGLDK